jgi:hypothetical protein
MPFDDRVYTEDSLITQLALTELHCKDGSAVDAGCHCVPAKHLFLIEGLSSEGVGFTPKENEKRFYEQLGALSRAARRSIEHDEFDMHKALHEAGLNPGMRAYLPHGLTETEKQHPDIRAKLSRCIKEAELSCCGKHTKHYETCSCNPVAVCRASVEH